MATQVGGAVGERARVRADNLQLRRVAQMLLVLLALALVIRAIYYVWMVFPVLVWPHEAIGGEATMLYEATLIGNDPLGGLRALYGPQPADAFIAGNYPPIYLILWALDPGASSFITGRALSLLWGIIAAIAGGIAIFGSLRGHATRPQRIIAGALGGAAFICTVPVFQQISIAKPDMTALGLAAVGLAFFENARGRRGIILAGIFFGLALLTKQSIGFALAAAFIAALRRGPKEALTLFLTTGAVGVVGVGFLYLLAGPTVFEHLITYNLRPWRQDRFESLNRKFLALTWLLIVPALAYAGWGIVKRGRSALTYYPIVALLVLYTVGSEGGARNYYIELCLATGLGAALALLTLALARPRWTLTLGTVAFLLVAIYAFRTYTVLIAGAYVPAPPVVEGGERNRLLALADAAPDPVLSDDVSYLAMRGRPAVIDDGFLSEHVRNEGLWNTDGIVAGIREHRYPLVLTPRSGDDEAILRRAWGDAVVDALNVYYVRSSDITFTPKR